MLDVVEHGMSHVYAKYPAGHFDDWLACYEVKSISVQRIPNQNLFPWRTDTVLMKSIYSLLLVVTAFASLPVFSNPSDETMLQRRERLRIAVQSICPVTGESLTEHDKPVKMTDPDTKEVLYVCCEACLKSKPEAKYLETIRSNFAKAQGHCLVMTDNEVSTDSKHGIIEGQFVYVCCPPCVKKMNADPAKFLAKLDDLYEASLKK